MPMIDVTNEPRTFDELKAQSDARIADLEQQVKDFRDTHITAADRINRLLSERVTYRNKVRAALIEFVRDVGTDTDDLNEILESLDLDPVVTSKEYNVTLSVQVTVEGDNIDWGNIEFDASAYDVSLSVSEGSVNVDNVDVYEFEEN